MCVSVSLTRCSLFCPSLFISYAEYTQFKYVKESINLVQSYFILKLSMSNSNNIQNKFRIKMTTITISALDSIEFLFHLSLSQLIVFWTNQNKMHNNWCTLKWCSVSAFFLSFCLSAFLRRRLSVSCQRILNNNEKILRHNLDKFNVGDAANSFANYFNNCFFSFYTGWWATLVCMSIRFVETTKLNWTE